MAPLVSTIDIARPQDEVFTYVTDPTTFPEWQAGVVGGSMEGGKTPVVGSKCTTMRRIGGAERASTSEVTKLGPPTRWAVHGIDGPIRAPPAQATPRGENESRVRLKSRTNDGQDR